MRFTLQPHSPFGTSSTASSPTTPASPRRLWTPGSGCCRPRRKAANLRVVRARGVVISALAALALAPGASAADNWLPHPTDATWTYQWTDSVYATTPTTEKVTVKSSKGSTFILAWTTDGLDNSPDAVSTAGTATFQESNSGIVNTDWSSTPPPPDWP